MARRPPAISQPTASMAERIAHAASEFELEQTGRLPKSVSVVMGEGTLVITLHGTLSPAECALANSPEGAAQVQELHRRLFDYSCESLRLRIKQITGADVREATIEVETAAGTVVKAFTSGTVVQVFLLANSLPTESWTGSGSDGPVSSDGHHSSDGRHTSDGRHGSDGRA